jgi:effector-binding domain-containing protein
MMNAETSGNDVEFRHLEPRPVLYIRATAQIEQLGEAMGDRIQALSSYIRERGAQPAGPPFVRYHTFGETETDFEFGVPVVKPVAGEGRIATGELPGGPAVSTWHFGPDDKLGEAYARIEVWLKEHRREPDGPAWEVYHWIDLGQGDTPTQPEPSTRGIQLVQPVK